MTARNVVVAAIFAALAARVVWCWWPRVERGLPVDRWDEFYDEGAE